MAVITAVVVTIFGGLTLILRDDTFVKMKPTILYALFAGILGFGLVRGQSYLRYLMDELIPMQREGWMRFTRRFVVFYLCLAVAQRGRVAGVGDRHLGELPHLRAAGGELSLHHGAGAAVPALRHRRAGERTSSLRLNDIVVSGRPPHWRDRVRATVNCEGIRACSGGVCRCATSGGPGTRRAGACRVDWADAAKAVSIILLVFWTLEGH